MITVSEIIAYLELATADPALCESIKSQLMKTAVWSRFGLPVPVAPLPAGTLPPLIPTTGISAIQCAVFDNDPKGENRDGIRYGAALEIWTAPAADIKFGRGANHAFKINMSLYDNRKLKDQVRAMRRPRRYTVDEGYLDDLAALKIPKGAYFGIITTIIRPTDTRYEPGTFYHPYQFVWFELADGRMSSAKLALGEGVVIDLGEFVTTGPGGNPLAAKVIGQARTDLCGFSHSSWRTNGQPD